MENYDGPIVAVGALKRNGHTNLVGMRAHNDNVCAHINAGAELVESLRCLDKKVSQGKKRILLNCAIVHGSEMLPSDIMRKRAVLVRPQNGSIRHLHIRERVLDVMKRSDFSTHDSIHAEHLAGKYPGYAITFYPDEFGNWVMVHLQKKV